MDCRRNGDPIHKVACESTHSKYGDTSNIYLRNYRLILAVYERAELEYRNEKGFE